MNDDPRMSEFMTTSLKLHMTSSTYRLLFIASLCISCAQKHPPQPWQIEPANAPKPAYRHYAFNYKPLEYNPEKKKRIIELVTWNTSVDSPLHRGYPGGSWIKRYRHLWYELKAPFDHSTRHHFQCKGHVAYEVDDYVFMCSGGLLAIYVKPGSSILNPKKDPVPGRYRPFFFTKDIETRRRTFEVDVRAPDGERVRLTYAFDALLLPSTPVTRPDGLKYWPRRSLKARFVKARHLQ